jgi:Response regulator with putative antiterminator output domain
MFSALIVSPPDKGVVPLAEILLQNNYSQIVTAGDCSAARRSLLERAFDLAVINAPLSDETGEALSLEIAEGGGVQVILLVRDALFDDVTGRVAESGVFTVSKPINKTVFWSALKLAASAHIRLLKLETEKNKLLKRIDELQLINRAKCLLIQYLGITEEQAHKYIERQAMDLRITRLAVAKNVLKTYQD